MATIVYGESDDLVEFDGDITAEFIQCIDSESDQGLLLVFSDGSVLEMNYVLPEVPYSMSGEKVWIVECIRKGLLFDRIGSYDTAGGKTYSDVAYFRPSLKWAYVCTQDWEKVECESSES